MFDTGKQQFQELRNAGGRNVDLEFVLTSEMTARPEGSRLPDGAEPLTGSLSGPENGTGN